MSKKLHQLPLGLYEKALPPFDSWHELLQEAKGLGFSFVEMSIDESEMRRSRLKWGKREITALIDARRTVGMRIPSICLSCHRATPFGSADKTLRARALTSMKQAIDLADALGVRVIQLAGYDVYYEAAHEKSLEYFVEVLSKALDYAAQAQVMLGMEIMDTEFMNSVSKFLSLKTRINAPWLGLYPDLGNLSAWNAHPAHELIAGLPHTLAVHLKDTRKPSAKRAGQFRDVPFGAGCVNFDALFFTLATARYQGPFVIEMWARGSLAQARNDVAKAKTWLIEKMMRSK